VRIAEQYAEIQARIEKAAFRAHRSIAEVHLLAVSKKQPIDAIEEAYSCGVRNFGENYVQELLEKKQSLIHLKDIRWHLIGHLQTNKVKQVIDAAHCFQALDSEKLLSECAKRASSASLKDPWSVFIQVNIDKEESKSGVLPEHALKLAQAALVQSSLKLDGLMCIPKPQENVEAVRDSFIALRQLAQVIEEQTACSKLKLSMGMSEDFEIAIEEGANWVRVGRKLFGERQRA